MADGIYVGMAGASARAAQLEAVADNLANAQSPGFKAARPAFQTFLPPRVRGDKAFVAAVATGFDLRPGPITRTGNPLDVAPDGESFLSVRAPDGKVAYTRSGRLEVTADGQVLAAGRPLLGLKGEPVVVPLGAPLAINADGVVTASGVPVNQIPLFEVKGRLSRIGPALFGAAPDTVSRSAARLRVGELELGNASPLEAAVQMVAAQRHFETSMQAIETYRKLGDRSTEVGRVR